MPEYKISGKNLVHKQGPKNGIKNLQKKIIEKGVPKISLKNLQKKFVYNSDPYFQ